MAKSKKQKDAYIKSKQKPVVQNKTYELQIGKTVDCLKNAVAQLQYPLVINLVPTKRTVNKEQIAFGNLIRNGEKETVIDTFYQGIIGLDLTKNERIILNVLATLISNSNFQTDINKNDVDLRTTTFKFSAKLIRDLSGINDIDPIIKGLSRPFVFKTNNKGGHYVIDRLLRPVKKNSEDKTPKKIQINSKLKPLLNTFTKGRKVTEPLFLTIFKNRMDRSAAYRILNYACSKAGIEANIGCHSLRKTFGYHYYKKYKDVVMLQKIFNHSHPEITLRYICLEQDKIDESYIDFIL